MNNPLTIGVLALQGAIEPHRPHIEAAGAAFKAVKTPAQFDAVDAFILPGGESTTMLKLIETFDLWDSLERNFKIKPVWGICAGAILLAEHVINPAQKSFGLMPITAQRNGYGRQLESHQDRIDEYDVSFIRAPVITILDENIEIMAEHSGNPAWLCSEPYMVTTFHPELTLDYPSPMHRAFMDMVQGFYMEKAA